MFQVRSGDGKSGPWTYTVAPSRELLDTWRFDAKEPGEYALSVYGPNGYFREFKGSVRGAANLFVTSVHHPREPGITLEIHNRGSRATHVRITDAYGRRAIRQHLEVDRTLTWHWSLEESFGWYDLTVEVESDSTLRQRLAGHVETGRDSVSDPALGR